MSIIGVLVVCWIIRMVVKKLNRALMTDKERSATKSFDPFESIGFWLPIMIALPLLYLFLN